MKFYAPLLSTIAFVAFSSLITCSVFWLKPQWKAPYWLFVQLYFAATTMITVFLALRGSLSPSSFVNRYIFLVTIKLLLSLCILILFGMTNRSAIVSFFLYFLICYLGYLVFETLYLFRAMKKERKN